jgi:hypothetical protein
MVFLSSRVIIKIKGIIGKVPKINIKHGYNIIYVENLWEYVSTNYKVHAFILHHQHPQA